MTTKVVTDEQLGHLARRQHDLFFRVTKGAVDFNTVMDGLQLLADNRKMTAVYSKAGNWLQSILACEREYHVNFFGCGFDLSAFRTTLKRYGEKRIKGWQALGLEPHFLPRITMVADAELPGWKIKPEKWFWDQVAAGKILRSRGGKLEADENALQLEGITVLVDTRLKPAYENGKQMYENDNLLGPIIEGLRKKGKIAAYQGGPQPSRFGVSPNEWEEHVKPAYAKMIGLELQQVRLERAIEANTIPQMYRGMPRKDDGNTNTRVWYEECFGGYGYRLFGGHSDRGGLAHVGCDPSDYHWSDDSFRPLAVL